MTEFILVRHGYSITNKSKSFTGQMDVPLDDVGKEQGKAVSDYIYNNYKVDAIYSSDLMRAKDTVSLLSEKTKLSVITRKDLREIDVGTFQGRSFRELSEKYPEEIKMREENPGEYRFPGGESHKELLERALYAIEKIAKENEGKRVVIATHGGVIRVLVCAFSGLGISQLSEVSRLHNASITVVKYDNGKAEFLLKDYTGHLPEETI